MYDLTIFKLHAGRLTVKIYTKGERVLRVEAMAHNTQALGARRALGELPRILSQLKAILERFLAALSCIDRCFVGGEVLDTLPTPLPGWTHESRRAGFEQTAHALGRRGRARPGAGSPGLYDV